MLVRRARSVEGFASKLIRERGQLDDVGVKPGRRCVIQIDETGVGSGRRGYHELVEEVEGGHSFAFLVPVSDEEVVASSDDRRP